MYDGSGNPNPIIHHLLDPLDFPDMDVDEFEAECLRRSIKVYREFIDDDLGSPRWGLRLAIY